MSDFNVSEYHNVTWTWLDLLLALKTDSRRVILTQAIRQKLTIKGKKSGAEEGHTPQEEDKARILFGARAMVGILVWRILTRRKKIDRCLLWTSAAEVNRFKLWRAESFFEVHQRSFSWGLITLGQTQPRDQLVPHGNVPSGTRNWFNSPWEWSSGHGGEILQRDWFVWELSLWGSPSTQTAMAGVSIVRSFYGAPT